MYAQRWADYIHNGQYADYSIDCVCIREVLSLYELYNINIQSFIMRGSRRHPKPKRYSHRSITQPLADSF